MEEIIRLYVPLGVLVMLFFFINTTPASADLPRLIVLCVMVLVAMYLVFYLIENIGLMQVDIKKYVNYTLMTALVGMAVGAVLASIFSSKQ